MDARLQEFAQLLRQNGVRVSPAELADAERGALLVGLEDRSHFRAALRAALVKRGADAPLFDRVFDLFFLGAQDLVEGLQGSLQDALNGERLKEEDLAEIARALRNLPLSDLTAALLEGRTDKLARLLRQAMLDIDFRGLTSPLQRGFYARRVLQSLGAPQVEEDLRRVASALRERGMDEESVQLVARKASETLQRLEDAARRIADREQRARDPGQRGETGLQHRALASLSPAEVERMREVVKRLAERLKARLSRRRKVRRRGQLSVRRTLRRNLSCGGVPAALVFRARRQERPEIVVLCDVSDSVRNASRLMLQFVYTLQSLYARVRSFVFVSDIAEATHLFKNTSVEAAVDLATAGKVINLAANSNYGRALHLFQSTYLGSINRRTTVIVIGDGRTNYNPPNAWALQEIKRRCRRLLWLCPEDRASWGFGDSEMPLYARQCHRADAIRSVDDLARLASEILP